MPRLIVHPRTPQAREIHLQPGENRLGRVPGNHFQIEDPSVSSSHCQIIVQDGQVTIKDLGSTNGTFLNRAPVQEAVLRSGHTLHLGVVELLFVSDEPASAGPASPPVARILAVSETPPVASPVARPTAPPSPPPVTFRPVVSARPVSAPVAAPAAEPVDATVLHVGVQSCKFHPDAAARWMCQPCHKFYCDSCVGSKRVGLTTQHLCRACGGPCVPVIATAKAKKVRLIKQYSDAAVLGRSIGLAFAGAVAATAVWVGFVWWTGFDVSFIFMAGAGALCGYGVKYGSQDRPGFVFSAIAVSFCLLAMVAGKLGAMMFTHETIGSSISKLVTDAVGVVAGLWLAYWLSGGDA